MTRRRIQRRAFSLAELLVVIGLTGIVLGMLLPAVQSARELAARAGCLNNLKQIGLALHNYHDSLGCLPPSRPVDPSFPTYDPDTLLSWMALVLPYLDQEPLWKTSLAACATGVHPSENPPHVGFATPIPLYVCPDDGRLLSPLSADGMMIAFTSYIGSGGIPGAIGVFPVVPPKYRSLGRKPGLTLPEITDGTSNTLLVCERPPPAALLAGDWYSGLLISIGLQAVGPDQFMQFPSIPQPEDLQCSGYPFTKFSPGRLDNPCDRFHLWSLHPGGGNFAFADGSARFLTYSVNNLIPSLSTACGGEVVSLPE